MKVEMTSLRTSADDASGRKPLRIRYVSDLHGEFTGYHPRRVDSTQEDLVILAGDIGVGLRGIEWARQLFPRCPVLYVLGNHEFYGLEFDGLIADAREACRGTNVTLLENDAVEIGSVRFLGCSLWTDFEVSGAHLKQESMEEADEIMNDYRVIRRGKRRLTPEDTLDVHRHSLRWLEGALVASSLPTVVITHHVPTGRLANPRFLADISNGAFYSNLDRLFQPPVRCWISGHSHFSGRVDINGIPLLSNQRGYPMERGDFSWARVLEL